MNPGMGASETPHVYRVHAPRPKSGRLRVPAFESGNDRWKPPRLLRLRAEMRVPGRAWVQFEAMAEGSATRLVQTAHFAPTGLFGWLYWYGIYPAHAMIFSDLVDAVARDELRRPAPE